jgi:O-antigen/teichoic acid export membrane protein
MRDARGNAVRHQRMLNTLSNTFWVLILSIIVLFAFFAALGAFSPGEVAGLTVAVIVLTILWILHALWESRHRDGRDPATIRARERRGF